MAILPTMFTRLLSVPTNSIFLFGPRGTGKSTWLRVVHPDDVQGAVDHEPNDLAPDLLPPIGRVARHALETEVLPAVVAVAFAWSDLHQLQLLAAIFSTPIKIPPLGIGRIGDPFSIG